jgi:hypothetical protein
MPMKFSHPLMVELPPSEGLHWVPLIDCMVSSAAGAVMGSSIAFIDRDARKGAAAGEQNPPKTGMEIIAGHRATPHARPL